MQSLTPVASSLFFTFIEGVKIESSKRSTIQKCAELTHSPVQNIETASFPFTSELPGLVGSRSQLIVFGGRLEFEVTQFVLAAIPHGFHIFLVADAISSENSSNTDLCLERLYQFGVVPILTKQLIWELGLQDESALVS